MRLLLLLLANLFIFNILNGQDRVFARTYQSNVLAKGQIDLEYISTLRMGKKGPGSPYSFGRRLDSRLELEFGLGKNLQTAFYYNTTQFTFGLIPDAPGEISTQTKVDHSFSNEWKWKMSDPVANSLGSALYLEFGIGTDEYEIESKLILDKQIQNHLFALNLTSELEWETEYISTVDGIKEETHWESPVELNCAYMYFLKKEFGLGMELRSQNGIEPKIGWRHSALFAGPTLYYQSGRWWGVFNVLPQWVNLKKTESAPYSKVLDDLEKIEIRLLLGISF